MPDAQVVLGEHTAPAAACVSVEAPVCSGITGRADAESLRGSKVTIGSVVWVSDFQCTHSSRLLAA